MKTNEAAKCGAVEALMAKCDRRIENYVRREYYGALNALSPTARFAKKFALLLDALQLELREGDEFFGWFVFEGEWGERPLFSDERLTAEEERILAAGQRFGSRTVVDRAHTLLDYGRVLREGLASYGERIERELALTPDNEYLLAMRDTLLAVRAFVGRLLHTVEERLAVCGAEERERLWKIRAALRRVPYYPAEDFRDAVQAIWLLHFLAPLAEDAWYSISLGSFDQYVYPYYLRSREAGMTVAEAKRILRQFYELLNSYADGACLLNVGGESYNELSMLLIECQKEFAFPAPILAARVTETTADGVWDALIDEALFSRGQPTFYGEESCVGALVEKGVAPEKAKQFANNSCMGIGLAGEEFNSMWGCVLSVSAALEAALCEGRIAARGDTAVIPGVGRVECLEDVYAAFERCASQLLDCSLRAYDVQAKYSERLLPDCFVSLLTEGCIEKRCDRISGARYHNVVVECFGMVNVADGICAVDQLVFESKKYTLDEINAAVKCNFKGYEAMRADILACPKFGRDEAADAYAARVADILQRLIRAHDRDNRFYSPSLHTLDGNVGEGALWGAGYDGRAAGEPFAKNGGASNTVRRADPTSLILASSKLPQHQFFGGQPIDVCFAPDAVKEHKREIAALIKVYLQRGGLQFQVNSISSGILRAAIAAPESYPHLVVRIGGYSLYFNSLSPQSKAEFAERFEKEGL